MTLQRSTQTVVAVDHRNVSLAAFLRVVGGARVLLSANRAWRSRIARGRHLLEAALEKGEKVYGVSTGVGNSSWRGVDTRAQQEYSLSIMEQHGCGVGAPLSPIESRAVVFARLISLSKGLSAVRFGLLEALCGLLNHDIAPVIPRWGSVGASGDLTPLSYVAAALAGGRNAYHRGRVTDAARALQAEGLKPFVFGPKEPLAIMNGTSVMTGVGILAVDRFERLLEHVEHASALAAEVLLGRSQAFAPLVHDAKPHPGQLESARRMRVALRGSRLLDPPTKGGRPVQDRYSIRCVPQVVGSARDAVAWAKGVLQIELNSVNDNPLVDPEKGEVVFGGNFFGGHPALVMDTVKISAASVADLVDRQFALLVDEHHNMGMPETLVPYGGCGVKGLQVTCSALTARAIHSSFPDSALSRPTEAGNQDKVSMGLHAALHASEVVSIVSQVLATQMIALSNAARFRDESRLSPGGRRLLQEIRTLSPVLAHDRPLDGDIGRLATWLGGAELLQ